MKRGNDAGNHMILPADSFAKVSFEVTKMFQLLGGNGECVHPPQPASGHDARSLWRWSSMRFAAR